VVSSTGSVSGVGAGLFSTNGDSVFAMASLKRACCLSIMLGQGIIPGRLCNFEQSAVGH